MRKIDGNGWNVNLRNFAAGFFAGFCYTNVAFIFDLLKVRAQENKDKVMKYHKEIIRIYQEDGLMGFSKGYQAMLVRDGPGFGLYFMGFEFNKRFLGVSEKDRKDNYNGMSDK